MLAKIVFYRFMDRGGVEFHKNARKQRGQYSAIFDQTSLAMVKTIYCIAYREIPLARHRLHARWANHSQANIFPSLASHLRVVCTALTGLVALPSVFVVTGIFFFLTERKTGQHFNSWLRNLLMLCTIWRIRNKKMHNSTWCRGNHWVQACESVHFFEICHGQIEIFKKFKHSLPWEVLGLNPQPHPRVIPPSKTFVFWAFSLLEFKITLLGVGIVIF